ncbi:MAG: single-stranded DNA-binding protein [Methylacidiphilales bacterium]|nr:single-stranded DNA-binding protein [Candidatus Methylacidiphilales bacterium]MDW8350184.1 single-stranded DNA-binding protein [Verrucomicrobiae bacterium]
MADLNKVMLIGNLTRDPEVRYTPKGVAVADMGLAINSTYRAQDGQIRDEVCYVDVVAWGRQAETCKEYLTKGSPIFVEGRLQYEQWETKDGEKRNRIRVRAERVQFLGRGGGRSSGAESQEKRGGGQASDGSLERKSAGSDDAAMADIPEDDIPF